MKAVQKRIFNLALPVAEEEGLSIVAVDVLGRGRRLLLRITIDKETGVTVGDCERMSRNIEALLDVENLLPGPYTLEVSSPGMDRPLSSTRDFEKSIGKMVRIVTKEKIGNSSFFVGRLKDMGEGWIRIALQGKGGEDDLFIPTDTIKKARLEIEF